MLEREKAGYGAILKSTAGQPLGIAHRKREDDLVALVEGS